MKNNNSSLLEFALFICVLATIAACKKDNGDVSKPANPNETELITTVKLIIAPTSNPSAKFYASYRDLDGDGGNAPTIDTIRLDANTEYNVQVLVLDETKNPVDTTSKEIEAEKNIHEFFYSKIGTYNLATTYLDFDDHNVPVGLNIKINTTTGFSEKTNKLQIVLKHQPGLKPTTGNGDESLGETDVEVYFPILIQ
jgi:hypothetical protein